MPIQRLKIRMITQDSPAFAGADYVAARLRQLNDGFDAADALRPILPVPIGPNGIPLPPTIPQHDILNVYCAPEYFFRKQYDRSRNLKAGTAYTEQEKDTIKAALVQRSKRGPGGCLVMAGSIFWVVAGTGGWEVRNTVYVLHNGAQLLEYDKRHDCGELQTFEKIGTGGMYAFRPGVTQGTFNIAGLNCGVETCVDHDSGQLARKDKLTSLDLQFVLSNTVLIRRTSIAVHGRGYVVHCNAGPFGTRVYQNPFVDGGDIGPPLRGADGMMRHAFFDIPFPAAPAQVATAPKINMANR